MEPLKLVETRPGSYSLLLVTGTTPVDDAVAELGHEPNGYFWEGVAEFLTGRQAPALADRFRYDSEAGMFCAYGADRPALEELGTLVAPAVNDAATLRDVVAQAAAAGFEFDD